MEINWALVSFPFFFSYSLLIFPQVESYLYFFLCFVFWPAPAAATGDDGRGIPNSRPQNRSKGR